MARIVNATMYILYMYVHWIDSMMNMKMKVHTPNDTLCECVCVCVSFNMVLDFRESNQIYVYVKHMIVSDLIALLLPATYCFFLLLLLYGNRL